jgi:predicted metal-binding membrane protein
MEQNNFDIKKIKVHRTTEATVFEIVFAIVAVIVWGLIIWLVHRAPDIVPTHFDASGKPNAYGSPAGVTIPCIILTIAAIVLMVLAYFPRHINMPFKITNIQQVELAIRQLRIAGITFLFLPLAVAYMMLGMKTPSATPLLVVVGLIFLVFIVFTILIYKAK